jgi:hypothetical protein
VIESYAALESDLDRLRAAGALIAVDDAGAGYAGLHHLLMLRPAIIKVDRALVTDLDLDETKRALIEMLGTFASRVDAWLLAEGIERAGELEALAALGVPLVQGYYLARPGAAWPVLNSAAADQLATSSRVPRSNTLRSILHVAPSVRSLDEVGNLFEHAGVNVVVLIDTDDRPIATVTADTAIVGFVEPGLRMNVDTPVTEAALRAITRSRSMRFTPLLCIDKRWTLPRRRPRRETHPRGRNHRPTLGRPTRSVNPRTVAGFLCRSRGHSPVGACSNRARETHWS